MNLSEINKLIKQEEALLELSEITKGNSRIFCRMLERYIANPKGTRLRKVVEENGKTVIDSISKIFNSEYVTPTQSDIQDLSSMMFTLEEFFDSYGYEKIPTLRKSYLLLNGYVARHTVDLDEKNDGVWNPNKVYQEFYQKFYDENLTRIKEGRNLKILPEQFGFNTDDEIGQVKSLALADSLKHIRTGVDYSNSRGDLRFLFGLKSQGELMDESMLEGVKTLRNRRRTRHLETIRTLEGIQVSDLEGSSWLVDEVRKRMKERTK